MTGTTPGFWQSPDTHPRLGTESVHVWKIDLDLQAEEIRNLRDCLCADELTRADRFRFARHRHRFTAGRAALRQILGNYLGCDPTDVQFDYNEHGKPSLRSPQSLISFNLSNSHTLALLAITLKRRIGIDIEYRHRATNGLQIADHFFSPREAEMLRALPTALQKTGFLLGWTRKEAYIKAIGAGLSYPLRTFSVVLDPRDTPRLIEIEGAATEVNDWYYTDLNPHTDYLASIIVEHSSADLSMFRWKTKEING
ncbi:MAG TPA: 4'-phosphopantetheinyl transferase superfamily protein [Chromatiales bacterium]|jgi:4'-phosphopantetheinyl transferase|nr:4'-phosphopantetheinyl transferase superfamily protein [Chromatiaceae bacterium]HIO14585.1 4'-phosphopantetheinyl transferase superfamily protein [Chromatiales bacterium]HIO55375.1 4'-phosphopantetheinyl transferase superfamily protein [Chromatiales bacterium]